MKSTGIVRSIDDLGRIVLPKELRKTLGIEERDQLEIFVDGKYVMLAKYEPSCLFCGVHEDIAVYEDKNICKACMKNIAQSVNES